MPSRYLNPNDTIRTVSVGDVVVAHEEDQPREKWRVGKILDLIVGSDGCTRGALVQPYNISIILKLRGHIKRGLISRLLNFLKNLSSGLKIIR